jgi:hypothetical protein
MNKFFRLFAYKKTGLISDKMKYSSGFIEQITNSAGSFLFISISYSLLSVDDIRMLSIYWAFVLSVNGFIYQVVILPFVSEENAQDLVVVFYKFFIKVVVLLNLMSPFYIYFLMDDFKYTSSLALSILSFTWAVLEFLRAYYVVLGKNKSYVVLAILKWVGILSAVLVYEFLVRGEDIIYYLSAVGVFSVGVHIYIVNKNSKESEGLNHGLLHVYSINAVGNSIYGFICSMVVGSIPGVALAALQAFRSLVNPIMIFVQFVEVHLRDIDLIKLLYSKKRNKHLIVVFLMIGFVFLCFVTYIVIPLSSVIYGDKFIGYDLFAYSAGFVVLMEAVNRMYAVHFRKRKQANVFSVFSKFYLMASSIMLLLIVADAVTVNNIVIVLMLVPLLQFMISRRLYLGL